MRGLTTGQATGHTFLRSVILLSAWVLLAALLMAPFTWNHTGSRGPLGLAAAASVCLVAGFAAEAVSTLLTRAGTPLGGTMVGMAIRMFPPLALCVALAASGQSGRQHLAFIWYLLTFYFVTLALETWLAVKRIAKSSAPVSPGN